eukprot:COSAG02_NODE_6434_length_3570_cov_5.390666_1_plen_698_part_00
MGAGGSRPDVYEASGVALVTISACVWCTHTPASTTPDAPSTGPGSSQKPDVPRVKPATLPTEPTLQDGTDPNPATRCVNNEKGEQEMLACKWLKFGRIKDRTLDLGNVRPGTNFPPNFLHEDNAGRTNRRDEVLLLLTRPAIHQIFGLSTPRDKPLEACYRSIFEANGPLVTRARVHSTKPRFVNDERLARAIECIGDSVQRRREQRLANIRRGYLTCTDWTSCAHNHCKMLRTVVGCHRCLQDELDRRRQVQDAAAMRQEQRQGLSEDVVAELQSLVRAAGGRLHAGTGVGHLYSAIPAARAQLEATGKLGGLFMSSGRRLQFVPGEFGGAGAIVEKQKTEAQPQPLPQPQPQPGSGAQSEHGTLLACLKCRSSAPFHRFWIDTAPGACATGTERYIPAHVQDAVAAAKEAEGTKEAEAALWPEPGPEPVVFDDDSGEDDKQASLDSVHEWSLQEPPADWEEQVDVDEATRGHGATRGPGATPPRATIGKRRLTITRQEARSLLGPGAYGNTLPDCDGRFRCIKKDCERCNGNLRETGYPEGRPGRNDAFKQHLYQHVFEDAKAAVVELCANVTEEALKAELRDDSGNMLKRDDAIKRLREPPAVCTALREAHGHGLRVSGSAGKGLTVECCGEIREFEPTDYAICGDLLTAEGKRNFGLCAPNCQIGCICQGEVEGRVRFLPPPPSEQDVAGLPA